MNPPKNNLNNWVKFSQVGLQMAVTIAICAYLGYLLEAISYCSPLGDSGRESLWGICSPLSCD